MPCEPERPHSLDPEGELTAELEELCARLAGVRVRAVEPLAADLGTRRFFRLRLAGPPGSLIARVEAPEDPQGRPTGAAPEPPLEPLRHLLETAGLPVPRSFGTDPSRGVDLLEDLGDCTLEAAALESGPETRRALYATVCACVPPLQALREPESGLAAFRRRLDRRTLAYKGELFARWSLPGALGRAPRAAEREAVAEGFAAIADGLADAPARLAHRDLQSRNVLVRTAVTPDGTARIGLIDLQGAWLAPPEYDLVCLLRDSYVELPDAEVDAQAEAVRPALPDRPDAETFRRRFDLLTLARKGKDHARLLYAAATRDEPGRLAAVPATVRALRAAAARRRGEDARLDRLAALVHALPEDAGRAGGVPCGA